MERKLAVSKIYKANVLVRVQRPEATVKAGRAETLFEEHQAGEFFLIQ